MDDSELSSCMANLSSDGHVPKWTCIARCMTRKSAKQCRERYLNHLSPTLSKSPFRREEDAHLYRMVKRFGTRWAHFHRVFFPSRSANQLKNRWQTISKTPRRQRGKQGTAMQQPALETKELDTFFEGLFGMRETTVPHTTMTFPIQLKRSFSFAAPVHGGRA